MKVKYTAGTGAEWESELSNVMGEALVEDALRQSSGIAVDNAGCVADKAISTLSELCEMLVEKGVLNIEDIQDLTGDYTIQLMREAR